MRRTAQSWHRGLVCGLTVLFVCGLACSAVLAQDKPDGPTIVGVRLHYDQDSCPDFAEVYLAQVRDTISAFELRLSWDRSDFARFETRESSSRPDFPGDSAVPAKSTFQPVIVRDSSTLGDWEYVEARGQSGLWVKVTAFAYLTAAAPERLIVPGQGGTLLRLLLTAGRPAQNLLPGDSAILHIDPGQTRLSRLNGQLLDSVVFRDATARIPACDRLGEPQ